MNASFGILSVFMFVLYIGLIGLSILGIVLFIKLATRGIKALDIYINEKTNKTSL